MDLPRNAFEVEDDQVEDTFEWDGASGSAQFAVACLRGAELRRHACKAVIRINGEIKATLRFTLNVVAKCSSPPGSPPSEVEVELDLVDRQAPPEPADSAPHGGWASQSDRAKTLQDEIDAFMLRGLPQTGIPPEGVPGWVGADLATTKRGVGSGSKPEHEAQVDQLSHRLRVISLGLVGKEPGVPVVHKFRYDTLHNRSARATARTMLLTACWHVLTDTPLAIAP